MRVYMDDGGGAVSQPSTSSPQNDQAFQGAVAAAKAATAKVTSSGDTTHIADASAAWGYVESLITQDYRIAALSDPTGAKKAGLDQQFSSYLRSQGIQSDWLLKTANTEINTETKDGTLQYQSDIFQAKQDVAAAQAKVTGANPSSAGEAALTAAINKLVNLELQHDVSSAGPAGPNGSHSVTQWTAAGTAVKKDLGATDDSLLGKFIDQTAQIQGYLDNIQNNPASLHLTPAEQAMAGKDPVALALLKANGVTLTADGQITYTSDGNASQPIPLSPGMQQLAQQDPSLFAVLALNHVNFTIVGTLPQGASPDSAVGVSQYLRITVNGQEVAVTKAMAQQYEAAGSNAPFVLANLLLSPDATGNPPLQLSQSSQIAMTASDDVRGLYGAAWMNAHMSGSNPDVKGAISFLGTQLNGFYSLSSRQAFWQTSGQPYLQPLLQAGVNGVQYQDGQPYLTELAQYMNRVLSDDAPPEVAKLLIGLVEDRVTKVFTTAFQNGQVPEGVNSIFYAALSKAVQIADQMPGATQGATANQVAAWLSNAAEDPAKGGSGIPMIGMFTASKLNDAISAGYTDLASALVTSIGNAPQGFYVDGFASDFKSEITAAVQTAQTQQAGKFFHQQYVTFNLDPGKVLTPFFDSFANDPMIGHPQALSSLSNTALDDIIGTTLNLTPTDPAAAKAHDYTKNWYAPNPADPSTVANWNTIQLTQQWIRSQSSPNSTITALPFIYASDANGIINSGLFEIDTPEREYRPRQGYKNVIHHSIIDGTAALDAIRMSGGHPVDSNNVDFQWHYSSLSDFQKNNEYSGGEIYLPTNMQVTEQNGHVSYQKIAAHVTTWQQEVKQGAGDVVAGLAMAALFVPGLDAAAFGLLAVGWGLYSSGSTLINMHDRGASIGLSNPQALQQWMAIIGDVAGVTKFGIGALGDIEARASSLSGPWNLVVGKGVPIVDKLAGFTATYIGTEQTVGAASQLAENWGSMSTADKISAFSTLAGGVAQVALGTMSSHKAGEDPAPDTQLATRAYQAWVADGRPQGGATAAIWTDAEQVFNTHAYQRWNTLGRPADPYWDAAYAQFKPDIMARAQQLAGAPDVRLAAARDEFGTRIAQRAYDLWGQDNQPDTAVTANYWKQARQIFDGKVAYSYRVYRAAKPLNEATSPNSAYKAWVVARAARGKPWGKPAGADEPFWERALAELQPRIDTRASELWDAARKKWGPAAKPLNAVGRQTGRPANAAEAAFGPDIGQRATRYWTDAGSPGDGVLSTLWSRAEQAFETSVGADNYRIWQGAGKPTGLDTAYWGAAVKQIKGDIASRAYELWDQAGRPKGLTAKGWRQADEAYTAAQVQINDAYTGYGAAVAKANGDFETAINNVYNDWVTGGRPLLAHWKEAKGAFTSQINTRAQALWNGAGNKGARPSRPFREQAEAEYGGQIATVAYEHWVTGGKNNAKFAPQWRLAEQNRDAAITQAAIDREAALGHPASTPAADLAQAGADRQSAIADGYRVWDERGKPTGFTAGYWRRAQNDIQETAGIRARLNARNTDFLGRWSTSKTTYKAQASQYVTQAKAISKTFGKAYAIVNGLGVLGWAGYYFAMQEHRNGGASLTPQNAYSELQKLQANPDSYLSTDYSTTLFGIDIGHQGVQNFTGHLMEVDSNGSVSYFRRVPEDLYDALKQSHDPHVTVKDGHLYVTELLPKSNKSVQVEIVPPYRDQPLRNVFTDPTATGGPGGRIRFNVAFGPMEGDRIHLNLELNGGYRYSSPTVTTIRLAAPSINQGWELGIRQQDTTLIADFRLSAGALDYNAAQVADLTNPGSPSNDEWMAMNFRAYWDIGNRNREEFNNTGSGSFLRMRETGFSEMGLGADFLKFTYGKDYVSLNGYYELQLYAPDFRDQLNFGSGFITSSSQALQPLPPLFLIDPALQLTWTKPPRLTDLPYVSGDVR